MNTAAKFIGLRDGALKGKPVGGLIDFIVDIPLTILYLSPTMRLVHCYFGLAEVGRLSLELILVDGLVMNGC